MLFKKIIFLLATTLALICCRGRIYVEGYFVNNSNDTLILTTNNGEQITLLPHSNVDKEYISSFDAQNRKKEKKQFDCCPCTLSENTFGLKPLNPSKTLLKKTFDKSNWSVEKPDDKIKCSFIVNQADIQ